MSELDYDKICDEILKINEKIRFAGIYDSPRVHGKMRDGVQSYLSEIETETSLNQALSRYQSRLRLKSKIGKPVFSMTKYDKLYRITIPIPLKEEAILCISTEPDASITEILSAVEGLIGTNL